MFAWLWQFQETCFTAAIVCNINCNMYFNNYVVGGNVGTGDQKPDYEFSVWTKPDCAGTSYENRNRSRAV